MFSQYTMPTAKRKTTKSWRHPLRKPTARAVPSAVKQQANSDDGNVYKLTRKTSITYTSLIWIFLLII